MKRIITKANYNMRPEVEAYWQELGVKKEEVLFVDIETTGLSARSAAIYQIGIAYTDADGEWKIMQWMCEHRREEKDMLKEFFTMVEKYRLLIHFNGTTFDLPFIKQRADRFGKIGIKFSSETAQMGSVLDERVSVDLLRLFSPLAPLLRLPNKKQKSFENFLGIGREDTMDGGTLIPVFCEYEQSGDVRLEHFLLIHNLEDMLGMLKLTELFAYLTLAKGGFDVTKQCLHMDKNFMGEEICELELSLHMDVPLPKKITCVEDGFYFTAEGQKGKAVLLLYQGTLKHFYDNYRDYYYLPKEDMAVYKSIGELVDKCFRQKATPATCYVKKEGLFLQISKTDACPCFYKDYKDKQCYTLYEDKLPPDILKAAILDKFPKKI
ncbi:MAG: hypothetical protein E7269_07390 [Lachnospiraceae bacterium]|nr:hypothetical protein [Lachnospiraceae bacterium]